MKTATLDISKILTVVTDNSAYNTTLSSLVKEASKFDQVEIQGLVPIAKFEKYFAIMVAAGYVVIEEKILSVEFDTAMNFWLTLVKH